MFLDTNAPPPDVVIILLPLKESTPISPKVPQALFIQVLPNASALSSKTGILNSLATLFIASTLYGIPYRCTAIIALGAPFSKILFSIAFLKSEGDIFHVSFSLSTKTGIAPKYIIGLADAEKVKL